jgi:hypothetical protein
LPTVHRQLRDWCLRRGFRACDRFTEQLDNYLRRLGSLSPETLLTACRDVRTIFFRENKVDRETIAQELAGVLHLSVIRAEIVTTTAKDSAQRAAAGPDLFISYHHPDEEFVRSLACAVSGAGYTVWYDRIGLTAGDSFPREIEHALGIARHLGLVCTAESCSRPWVRKEIEASLYREGAEERDIIIPLRLNGCRLPLLLRTKQWCDFTQSFKIGVVQLLDALSC